VLKTIRKTSTRGLAATRVAIVASKYNAQYVDGMLRAAQAVLAKAPGVGVEVVRVPGAFEIPVVAAELASGGPERLSALICIGVILRGETTHAQHIGEAVSMSLAQIQIQYRIPVIHEVLLLENKEQAIARCLTMRHNRGAEAAYTALEMARLMKALHGSHPRRRTTGRTRL
jgi:6,7-dimethyl-8-ribityllumazine synthase